MPWLLNFLYLVFLAILSPWLLYKAATTGKYRRGMLRKFRGDASHPLLSKNWPGPTVWLHGVSVGEIHVLRHVVATCKAQHPDWRLVVSTTTDTGYDEATKIFADLPVIWWPLDFSWAVTRALSVVKPDLIVLGESELWPNFLRAAKNRGVPVAVINGRMSPRSAARFEALRWLTRGLFEKVSLFAAQTDEYARRYRRLGGSNVIVTGSIKYDGAVSDRGNAKTQAMAKLLAIDGERGALASRGTASLAEPSGLSQTADPRGAYAPRSPALVWVAGSTQSPEEEICLAIFRKARERHSTLRLILVPRQKDRFDEVAHLLEKAGLPFVRRSRIGSATVESPIVLVDTIGELGAIWGLADVAFVGGSLDGQRGGQNMIEPAAYGAAVVFGPHTWNFKETVARLLERRAAVAVKDAVELEATILELLDDASLRQTLGDAARAFVRTQQGATQRTLEGLDDLLAAKRESRAA